MICPHCSRRIHGYTLVSILSMREREIIWMIAADGFGNDEIAHKLGISSRTVKAHLSRIFRKLDVANRIQLATYWNSELFQIGLAS